MWTSLSEQQQSSAGDRPAGPGRGDVRARCAENAGLVWRLRLQRNDGVFRAQGIPAPFGYLAIAAEFFGGLGLILGFLSRIAAFGVLCNMVVAVLTVHIHNGFFMNWAGTNKGEGFEYHLLAIAMALAVIIGGGGTASIDRALSGSDSAAG